MADSARPGRDAPLSPGPVLALCEFAMYGGACTRARVHATRAALSSLAIRHNDTMHDAIRYTMILIYRIRLNYKRARIYTCVYNCDSDTVEAPCALCCTCTVIYTERV